MVVTMYSSFLPSAFFYTDQFWVVVLIFMPFRLNDSYSYGLVLQNVIVGDNENGNIVLVLSCSWFFCVLSS